MEIDFYDRTGLVLAHCIGKRNITVEDGISDLILEKISLGYYLFSFGTNNFGENLILGENLHLIAINPALFLIDINYGYCPYMEYTYECRLFKSPYKRQIHGFLPSKDGKFKLFYNYEEDSLYNVENNLPYFGKTEYKLTFLEGKILQTEEEISIKEQTRKEKYTKREKSFQTLITGTVDGNFKVEYVPENTYDYRGKLVKK